LSKTKKTTKKAAFRPTTKTKICTAKYIEQELAEKKTNRQINRARNVGVCMFRTERERERQFNLFGMETTKPKTNVTGKESSFD